MLGFVLGYQLSRTVQIKYKSFKDFETSQRDGLTNIAKWQNFEY